MREFVFNAAPYTVSPSCDMLTGAVFNPADINSGDLKILEIYRRSLFAFQGVSVKKIGLIIACTFDKKDYIHCQRFESPSRRKSKDRRLELHGEHAECLKND